MAQDTLRDGFVRLCFDPSLNLLGDSCRIVVEGQFLATGAAPATADVLRKVTSVNDIDSNFGEGTVLGETLKLMIECCGNSGVEFFALPRADPAGATAAEYTWTFTGPATADGRVDIYMGDGRYNTSTLVTAGMTDADIATAVAANIDATFPYTATAAGGVVTLVSKNAGTVGNHLSGEYNWHGRNNYTPEGVTATFAQSVVGAGDLTALDLISILGECCVCGYALLTDGVEAESAVREYFEDAWSCDKPQCFGQGYVYNSGTLGQILARDTNSAELVRLAHGNSDVNFPYFKVGAYAAKSVCQTLDNPEISIQGPQFGVLDCVKKPESCDEAFTFDERNQLSDSGFVTTVPVSAGEGSMTSPQIVNDITNNRFDSEGRENFTFRSAASRRLAGETAIAIATQLQRFQGLGYFTAGTSIREGTQGTNKNVMLGTMRAWAESQVGILFSEFEDLDNDLTFTDDFETAPRCQGIPGRTQFNMVYRPPVRLRNVFVNAAPKLLDNC